MGKKKCESNLFFFSATKLHSTLPIDVLLYSNSQSHSEIDRVSFFSSQKSHHTTTPSLSSVGSARTEATCSFLSTTSQDSLSL